MVEIIVLVAGMGIFVLLGVHLIVHRSVVARNLLNSRSIFSTKQGMIISSDEQAIRKCARMKTMAVILGIGFILFGLTGIVMSLLER